MIVIYLLSNHKRKQEMLMAPCSTDRHEMSNLYREPSHQVLVHLDKCFQRRRFKCEELTDRPRTISDDKSSHGLWPGELTR